MKTNFIAIAITTVLACFTSAQDGLPSCAQSCVTEYTSGSEIAGCASLDIKCICSNSSFLSGIACCLASVCDATDQANAVAYAQNLCKTSGVTNLPSAVSCASTASSTASSTATSATGAASTTTSGSADSTTTSSTSTASGVVVNASSGASSSTTAGSSSKASASATTNSGSQKEIGAGAGMLSGLVAMVALL